MQPSSQRVPKSDDEEDLESLRLAALQSLKRPVLPAANGSAAVQVPPKLCNPKSFGSSKGLNKRGRGFHGSGRTARNGAFHSRVRSSNLISVPTIEPEESHNPLPDLSRSKKFSDESLPKLILPQDRYCNTKVLTENKVSEASSKFDRYNDSDKSDSESESEDERTSPMESPKKLQRANSLEALMQELENEIQGDVKPSVETVIKPRLKVKKSRKSKLEAPDSELSLLESDEPSASETETKIIPASALECGKTQSDDKNVKEESKLEQENLTANKSSPMKTKVDDPVTKKSKSPVKAPAISTPRKNHRRSPVENSISRNVLINQPVHSLPYGNPSAPIVPPLLPFQPMPYSSFNVPLNHAVPFDQPVPYSFPGGPPLGGPNDVHSPPQQMFSPRYERSLSPLTIKTDILNTITAPLSPRSAAFVLQNREIIERRKKSPRRSYSRSPSPEFLRSPLSPRYRSNSRPSRSPSPVRQRLSPNRRLSPLRRISPSSRRASPNIRRLSPSSQPSSRRSSPNARYRTSPPKRPSPSGRISPKRPRRSPPRSNIRNRLGAQLGTTSAPPNKPQVAVSGRDKERKRERSRSISLSLSPSPERFNLTNSPQEQQGVQTVDPVLEARRRKFEVNGTVATAGIIRLKPKASDEEEASVSNDNDKEEKSESQMDIDEEEELNEDELLGADDTYIDCNVRVDDLFSDEESDSENEGRFKSSRQHNARGMTVVPFTQLLSGSKNSVKDEMLPKEKRPYDRDRNRRDRRSDRSRSNRDRNPGTRGTTPERTRHKEDRDRERMRSRPIDRQRSRSPVKTHVRDPVSNSTNDTKPHGKSEGSNKSAVSSNSSRSGSEGVKKELGPSEKRPVKGGASAKVDMRTDRKKAPIVSPIESKKIEIKIRNPSKYEVESRAYEGSSKSKMEEPVKEKKSSGSRKVEVANEVTISEPEEENFDEPEPEVIVENEEDEDEDIINKNEGAGDLRAQLSRKRAERQNKLPKAGSVPSRLLQNALQGAVFKKSKKSKSKKKEKETAPLDGVEASVYAAVTQTTPKTGYGVADINCSTASKDRKVRVLHCDAEPLPTASGILQHVENMLPFTRPCNFDGKLPIHLRLGIPGSVDMFSDSKSHKKTSRKRSKNRGSFDQV